ncbi:DUF2637 domain-containing protein [Streptosporangium saharense]|uniref:DUF2637 domain-containing protein n=1 Tax=Streptosporangium saharense TaxID=1706840 RepID=UPI0033227636
MDVKSPAAAGLASRPSSIPTAQQSRTVIVLRRTGIALVGVGVAALAAAACVLSFEDLRALAITGEAPAGLAYLYPAVFDALLAVALISVLLLRGARWPIRLQAGAVLTLLLAGAVAAETATAVRATVDVRRAAVVVAVFPWVALLLALWLWLLLINHAAARRAAANTAAAGRTNDIVPFPEGDLPTAEYPVPVARPAHREHAGRHEEPVHHQPSEVVLDPQAAPPLDPAPRHAPPATPVTAPASEPVVGPTAAPETPEVTELPAPVPAPRVETETEAEQDPEPHPEPEREPDRPLRWGDLVRPHHGDLLVHPPRSAVQDAPDEPEETAEDPGEDTQPMAVATDEPEKKPLSRKTSENTETDKAEDAAPSGRKRSTPVPPGKDEE